ncbi:MAG: AAA family ATPase [Alphaproteobacteria bacterium]|nr:AAA family ATPase [Alphaproteobacteria bacterium]
MEVKQRKIFGHGKQEETLAKTITSGKIFPVWIFYGKDGIGKESIAVKFAKCLLIDKFTAQQGLDLDDDHLIHSQVDHRIHPDFFMLDMPSISVDTLRSSMNKIRMTPTVARRRVVIISNAEALNKNACNALLKILEEPPRDAIFILLCSNLGPIPITLLSRAYKLQFHPLDETILEMILRLHEVEDPHVLAKISEGSVGTALRIHDLNGTKLYRDILRILPSDYLSANEFLASVIENQSDESFFVLKKLIIQALKTYIDHITGINEEEIFETIHVNSISNEIEKVNSIISLLNEGEILQLDKNAMIAEAFELFFERSRYESGY